MKVFCRDCKEETDAIKIVDEDDSLILYCSRCGGDDVTTEYMECDLCGTINAHEDVYCSDFPEIQNICSNCVESARKEFFQLLENEIFSKHSLAWRAAVNIAYEGEYI